MTSDRRTERADAERVARDVIETSERPGDDDPEGQAQWDATADVAEGWHEPDDMDYNVARLNAEFALVFIGSQAVIVQEDHEAAPDDQLRFLKPEAFKTYFANRPTEINGHDGKLKCVTWATRWINDRDRRQYKGIEFHPDPHDEGGRRDMLNLWRGFSVPPRRGGSYSTFRDHLLVNVCSENEAQFRWLFGWFAQMMQKPREKPGTAIVLRGIMGSGKSTVGEVFGSLIAAHHFQVDDPRFVTGNFNSHMGRCLLLQADEATWAGDKTAEGRLKGLITSASQMIEAKGVDAIKLPNYVRLLKTTNSEWSVPAGKDERRFAVFDVAPGCAQNHEYFAEMRDELDAGGREALLHDLLEFDLTTVNLREIPKTGALLEQKALSLDPIDEWLLDRLSDGKPTRQHDRWPEHVETDALYDDFIRASERTGIRRRSGQTAFGSKLRKLLPGLRKARVSVADDRAGTTRRAMVYYLPALADCRAAFDEAFGQPFDWGDQDD